MHLLSCHSFLNWKSGSSVLLFFKEPTSTCLLKWQWERTATREGAKGDPCSGEALPGAALQSAVLFSSLPLCHSLEFNLTHSSFFYSDFASVSIVPSYSNPVILHRAGFVFPAILVRIGRFVDWWSKENYPVWILSCMTLLKTKGWMIRDNMSVLSYFIRLLQFFNNFLLSCSWDLRCTSAQAMPINVPF